MTCMVRFSPTSSIVWFLSAIVFAWASPVSGQSDGESSARSESETTASKDEAPTQDSSLRDRIEARLSGYHYHPDREAIEGFGPPERIQSILRTLVQDDELRPSMRLRALDTLALYRNPSTVSFLKRYLASPSEDTHPVSHDEELARLFRHHAIMGLARNRPDREAVELLEGGLSDDNLQIRLTTIEALGRHAGAAGRKRLRTFAEETREESVRSALEQYIDLGASSSSPR